MANRVVVPDLAPPEPIRPHPLQSDTFIHAAPPPIDNRLSSLADSLGFFNKNLMAYAKKQEAEDKKLRKDELTTRLEGYLAVTDPATRLADLQAGKYSWFSDPLIKDTVDTIYGQDMAMDLAKRIDAAKANKEINVGDPNFNADAHIRKIVAEDIGNIMARGPRAIHAYRVGAQGIIKNLQDQQAQALNATMTEARETAFASKIGQVLAALVENPKGGPQEWNETFRQVQEELGPRFKKDGKLSGSLDIPYKRGDELILKVFDQHADDPRAAPIIMHVLGQRRRDLDTGRERPALAENPTYFGQVKTISEKAQKALDNLSKQRAQEAYLTLAKSSLLNGDGGAHQLPDEIQVPLDPTNPANTFTLKRDDLLKEAARSAVTEIRVQNNGQENFEKEFQVTIANGIKHPVWINDLEATYKGLANTNVNNPQQVQQIIRASTLYKEISKRNDAYLEKTLSKDAREYYQLFDTLVTLDGQTPEMAAKSISEAYANANNRTDANVVQQNLDKLNNSARNMDFSWLPFYGGIANPKDVKDRVIPLANALVRTKKMSETDAIELAFKKVQDQGVYINGRVIFGDPDLQKDDQPIVNQILQGEFDKNKSVLKGLGITGPKDISLQPLGNGVFGLLKSDGSSVATAIWEKGPDGDPVYKGVYQPMISRSDLIAKRTEAKEKAAADFRNSYFNKPEIYPGGPLAFPTP